MMNDLSAKLFTFWRSQLFSLQLFSLLSKKLVSLTSMPSPLIPPFAPPTSSSLCAVWFARVLRYLVHGFRVHCQHCGLPAPGGHRLPLAARPPPPATPRVALRITNADLEASQRLIPRPSPRTLLLGCSPNNSGCPNGRKLEAQPWWDRHGYRSRS